MNSDYYSVLFGEILLAQHMTLENAMIFVEALFHRYYNEQGAYYTIKREEEE